MNDTKRMCFPRTSVPHAVRRVWTKGDTDYPQYKNVVIFFVDGFIVVAKGLDDPAPTWLNCSEVLQMDGVVELNNQNHL